MSKLPFLGLPFSQLKSSAIGHGAEYFTYVDEQYAEGDTPWKNSKAVRAHLRKNEYVWLTNDGHMGVHIEDPLRLTQTTSNLIRCYANLGFTPHIDTARWICDKLLGENNYTVGIDGIETDCVIIDVGHPQSASKPRVSLGSYLQAYADGTFLLQFHSFDFSHKKGWNTLYAIHYHLSQHGFRLSKSPYTRHMQALLQFFRMTEHQPATVIFNTERGIMVYYGGLKVELSNDTEELVAVCGDEDPFGWADVQSAIALKEFFEKRKFGADTEQSNPLTAIELNQLSDHVERLLLSEPERPEEP